MNMTIGEAAETPNLTNNPNIFNGEVTRNSTDAFMKPHASLHEMGQ